MHNGTDLVYFLSDHLGSFSMVVSDEGVKLSEQRYLPFATLRYPSLHSLRYPSLRSGQALRAGRASAQGGPFGQVRQEVGTIDETDTSLPFVALPSLFSGQALSAGFGYTGQRDLTALGLMDYKAQQVNKNILANY